MTALGDEFARRGLLRHGQVMTALGIDRDALKFLVEQRQLREVSFDWKGTIRHGISPDQIEGREAVFRGGLIRLVSPGA